MVKNNQTQLPCRSTAMKLEGDRGFMGHKYTGMHYSSNREKSIHREMEAYKIAPILLLLTDLWKVLAVDITSQDLCGVLQVDEGNNLSILVFYVVCVV